MTATNHALTGAFIGLATGNAWLAVPLAIASHFVCDAIPHYDVAGTTHAAKIGSKKFLYVQILLGAVLCTLIVIALALLRPQHWLLAASCAFFAASPDLLFIPRYLHVRRTGHDNVKRFWFWRFHNVIQWFQKPVGIVVELAWTAALLLLIAPFLH